MSDSSNRKGIERLTASMPSLDELDSSLRSRRFLGNLLKISAPPTSIGRHVADAFVHVVAKSLIEYRALRAAMLSFLADGIAEDYHRAQDQAESCVNSLHRAIKLLDRLRSLGFTLPDGQPYVPRARDLAILREANRKKVRDLRDAQEHIDSDVLGGRLPPDSDVTIRPMWDKLSLHGKELSYAEIAENVRQLHKFAAELSTVTIVVSEPAKIGAVPKSRS